MQKEGLVAVVHIQAGPHRVTSLMTREAADELGIEPGDLAVGGREVDERGRGSSTARVRRRSTRDDANSFGSRSSRWSSRPSALVGRDRCRAGCEGEEAARASITVSAAASLTEAFTKMGTDFQKANQGTTVTFNFAASSALAQQIQGGAPADVFASADGTNMQKLVSGGQVTAEPIVFAANELTIVVKPGNPKNVKSLADLADLDVVSLCARRGAVRQVRGSRRSAGAGVTIPPEKITHGRRREGDARRGRDR